jgi:hypothetical protein
MRSCLLAMQHTKEESRHVQSIDRQMLNVRHSRAFQGCPACDQRRNLIALEEHIGNQEKRVGDEAEIVWDSELSGGKLSATAIRIHVPRNLDES